LEWSWKVIHFFSNIKLGVFKLYGWFAVYKVWCGTNCRLYNRLIFRTSAWLDTNDHWHLMEDSQISTPIPLFMSQEEAAGAAGDVFRGSLGCLHYITSGWKWWWHTMARPARQYSFANIFLYVAHRVCARTPADTPRNTLFWGKYMLMP